MNSRAGLLAVLLAVDAAPLEAAPYHTDPIPETALVASLLGASALLELETDSWKGSPCEGVPSRAADPSPRALSDSGDEGLCDPREVPAFDRWSIGASSKTADVLSDLLLWSVAASPFAASALDAAVRESEDRGRTFADESLVSLEGMAVTVLLTAAIKLAIQRPRPLSYDPLVSKAARFEGDARLSFPSGHTSLSFAAATLLSVTSVERHSGLLAWAPAVLAYGAAASVGALRVAAGKHFFTDVLAGAVLGFAAGLVVIHLHDADGSQDRVTSEQTGALEPRHDAYGMRVLAVGGEW